MLGVPASGRAAPPGGGRAAPRPRRRPAARRTPLRRRSRPTSSSGPCASTCSISARMSAECCIRLFLKPWRCSSSAPLPRSNSSSPTRSTVRMRSPSDRMNVEGAAVKRLHLGEHPLKQRAQLAPIRFRGGELLGELRQRIADGGQPSGVQPADLLAERVEPGEQILGQPAGGGDVVGVAVAPPLGGRRSQSGVVVSLDGAPVARASSSAPPASRRQRSARSARGAGRRLGRGAAGGRTPGARDTARA